MTPRVQEDDQALAGFLESKQQATGDLLEYERRQAAALEGLAEMIERSRELTRRDPVLIEHQAAPDG
jgi:hypothetical protein